MTRFHLILRPEVRAQVSALSAERERDPGGAAAKEYVAVIKALKALRDGHEKQYEGKRLGYGPQSHDLRDCAELKVPVFEEKSAEGFSLGPSHRLLYREFDSLPTVEDGRVVPNPDALAFRQVVAFGHRATDPAALTGERLGRDRGLPVRDLAGLGGGKPSVGPQPSGVRTTPDRIPVPPDLLKAAALLQAQAAASGALRASRTAASRPATRGIHGPSERTR